jgi:hypothetical protein
MNKIKTNEVYVVNQPKHAIMTFIFVDPKEEITSNSHNLILNFSENTDVMFIFKNIVGIDPDAFTKVYGGCSWIVADKILSRTFIKAITYSIVIFKDVVGFLTFDLSDYTGQYGSISSFFDISKLRQVVSSSISCPIFNASHLDSSEMREIYSTEGKYVDTGKLNFPWKRPVEKRREYTTWKKTSFTAFFRPSLFEKLNMLSDDYIDSFTWNNIKYFLASACEYLGINRIKYDVFELNVNRLSDYVDSEGQK